MPRPAAVSAAGDKRKASSAWSEAAHSTKKPKYGSMRKSFADRGSDSDSSSEDGGVQLKEEAQPARQRNGADQKKGKLNGSTSQPKVFERGQSSRESHAKQKQLAQERRAAKPLADELQRTKKLWEKLRRKSHVPKEERQKLVDELYEIITGRIKDFVLKHDAVRAVQTAIKYSTPAQRKEIARELQGTYAELAESRYAKFLIGKLLVQTDEEIRDMIIPEFYGKVRRLINHPEASWILDDIYRGAATSEQKARLLREWYGPEFALFQEVNGTKPTADLVKIVSDEPSKRSPVLKYLLDMINQLIQKKMTGFTMLHDAMLQYFLALAPGGEEAKAFMEIVHGDEGGDLLKNMAFTKSGARLVCLFLAYGGAKDRKLLLRAYKDTFQLMCGDPYGHAIILAAYEVIDDTVLTAKSIFPEILGKSDKNEMENIIFCANNPYARTTVLYPFEGTSKSLFPASHATDLEILAEVKSIRESTSKKDPETRRKELVAALSPLLLAAVAASPQELVATSFGCQLVTDVLLSPEGKKQAAVEAVASTAAGDPNAASADEGAYPPPAPHISLSPYGGKMYRTLIAGGRFNKDTGKVEPIDPPLGFANAFFSVIQDHISAWATGPSSFAVVALLEADDFDSTELVASLLENLAVLEKAASEETAEQKAKREQASADAKEAGTASAKASDKKGGKKNKASLSRSAGKGPVGNAGTKLVLQALNR